MKRFSGMILLALFLACGTACNSAAPLYTPTAQIPNSGELTRNDIKKAIIDACAKRNWMVEKADSYRVVATQTRKSMSATVEITFSKTDYTINWKNSTGDLVRHDSSIHKKYNQWVTNLRDDIDASIAAARATKSY